MPDKEDQGEEVQVECVLRIRVLKEFTSSCLHSYVDLEENVDSREEKPLLSSNSVYYQFFDRVTRRIKGKDGRAAAIKEEKNHSPRHWLGARIVGMSGQYGEHPTIVDRFNYNHGIFMKGRDELIEDSEKEE